ncbi:hypothetical protein CRG98_007917 [Punica granatum]|uniref:Uncharacterized protein n=1 Tax=Punica granatum TaxID=22663 RepID=A0A2I0KT92_PUNGR|nr:hypothetical protein CRG98_007917 [Punica granatum]
MVKCVYQKLDCIAAINVAGGEVAGRGWAGGQGGEYVPPEIDGWIAQVTWANKIVVWCVNNSYE